MNSEQLRAARGLLRWSQADLAQKSSVSVPTIKRLEAMDGELAGHAGTMRSLQRAIEDAGVAFIPENGGGSGVRMKEPGKR